MTTSTTTTSPPARRRSARGHGEELRTDLLEAATALLAEANDPGDVSIRAVARAAGVSPTAVYLHFADRDALVLAAVERCFELFVEALESAVEGIDDPFEDLRARGRAYVRFATEHPGHYRVMFTNPLHHTLDCPVEEKVGYTAFEALVDRVQACLDAGAPADPDAHLVAVQIWTAIHGMVDLRITHPDIDWPPSEVLLDGLQRRLGLVPGPGADAG